MTEKDSLFKSVSAAAGPFVFDEKVAGVFPDMISRSVPGYDLIVPMLGMLARRYALDGTNIYDLGCSLRDVHFIAVDNSAAMVKRCREIVAADGEGAPVSIMLEDVGKVEIRNASVVALNFTLQFVPPGHRGELLSRIAQGLCSGGVLLLSEKIRFTGEAEDELQTAWHHDYKRSKGYSDLEIAAKRTALENVLHPDTAEEHVARLTQAGFSTVRQWFQCFSFCSFIAIR